MAEESRVKTCHHIFQEQLVESLPVVKLLYMRYKTKLRNTEGGSTDQSEQKVKLTLENQERIRNKLHAVLMGQLVEDLCKKYAFSVERYNLWFNDVKNE